MTDQLNIANDNRPHVENYFGGCPDCGQTDRCMNVGSTHFFVCHEHRTAWEIGANLFSSWKDESEETWQQNVATLENYNLVEPLPCSEFDTSETP